MQHDTKPLVILPSLASLWQTGPNNVIFLWLISTLLAQHSIWMHLLFFTLLLPSSFNIEACSIVSTHHIACGIWTALVWEQLMPAPLHYFIPIASILITSFGLRFLPIPACMPRIAISSTSVHQDYHQRSSHGGNTGVLPEGSWYNWTAGQVQEWVQRCISADPEIAQAFHKHNIQGLDLPLLTVSDYQSIGLPLGVACHLKREFDKLQAKDKFIATDHGTGTSTTLGWLEQLNQQHSNSTNSTIALQFYDELKDEYGISVSADAVKTIFQERFGNTFTLPQLSSHQGLANIGVRQKGVFDTDKPPSSIRQSSKLPTDIPLVQNGLPTPKEFSGELPGLSSMPPHIRSIYERKPHLVNQFLAQKQRSCNEEQRALLSADNQEEGHTPEDEHGGIYHSIQ